MIWIVPVVAVALMLSGLALAYVIGAAAVLSFLAAGHGRHLAVLPQQIFSQIDVFALMAMPLFILAGEVMNKGGVTRALINLSMAFVGRLRGGLGHVNIMASVFLSGISGSAIADAAALSNTLVPEMRKQGYKNEYACALTAASSIIGPIIPPSIILIFYGALMNTSVTALFIAGIVPGLLVTLTIALTVFVLCLLDPSRAPPGRSYSWREKLISLRITGAMLVLMLLVTGVIYLGVATPTEAACLGAFGALCIALLRRRITWSVLFKALSGAARTSAMISMIIIGAHIFGYALTITQTTQTFVAWVGALPVDRYVIIAIILLLYIVLGCFLDQVAILILTVPILVPVIKALGFDPIWFGILVILTAEVGMVTPPVGMNVFVVARYTGRPVDEVFAGVFPHVWAHLLLIALLAAFPGIVLWLPSTMLN